MMNRADKAALLPVQKIHSLAGIYTGVISKIPNSVFFRQKKRVFHTFYPSLLP